MSGPRRNDARNVPYRRGGSPPPTSGQGNPAGGASPYANSNVRQSVVSDASSVSSGYPAAGSLFSPATTASSLSDAGSPNIGAATLPKPVNQGSGTHSLTNKFYAPLATPQAVRSGPTAMGTEDPNVNALYASNTATRTPSTGSVSAGTASGGTAPGRPIPARSSTMKQPPTRPSTPSASAAAAARTNSSSSSAGGARPAAVPAPAPLSFSPQEADAFPATDVIKYLIQIVGRDVISFRRNTQVSYMVVERAKEIVSAINRYIKQVEGGSGDWGSFEKFTAAIAPLEDTLFKLLAFTEDEKARYFASSNSVDDCISSTESWAENREKLLTTLEEFHTQKPIVDLFTQPDSPTDKNERLEAQTNDDKALLEDVIGATKARLAQSPPKFPPYVDDVQTPLDNLLLEVTSGAPSQWFTIITIKTSMLVEGVLEIIEEKSVDADVLNHLKSKRVWQVAQDLLKLLTASANATAQTTPAEVQAKYDEFLLILKEHGDLQLPESYVDLMKQAGYIRRPFQAQAFALILLCRFLADHFTKTADSTVENVNSLEEAIDETLLALKAAVQAVTELRNFDLTNFERNTTINGFQEAEKRIKESFESFGLLEKWNEKQGDLAGALKKDKDRMTELNKMISKKAVATTEGGDVTVKVAITVVEDSVDGTELKFADDDREGDMRLTALRWIVAGTLDEDDVKRARLSGAFFLEKEDGTHSPCALHSTIADIAAGKTEISLRLVIASA
ncbi:hypothetical protein BC834DRAFT_971251 [Gloeopeniophorella convolvens]|nr:hypothetical protein BC834DRAFT_971251 [Gloeopeniophorella convolvens]